MSVPAPAQTIEERVAAVRSFNRFYTPLIGLLDEGYLDSDLSLTEARVVYELGQQEQLTAAQLGRRLGLDRGYLSRLLASLGSRGLVSRRASARDRRQRLISLSPAGREVLALLDRRSRDGLRALLERYSPADQQQAVEAMEVLQATLSGDRGRTEPVLREPALREPRPGDLGWVVAAHGATYAREYGWDQAFEALVAQIVADYARSHDPASERCWIAELGGRNVGSVFCVRRDEQTAQLRLLLVEPAARGLGLGRRLVDECIGFAREAGYRRMMLWTNDVLRAARRIYETAGFVLVEEEAHHSFGHELLGQTWELDLSARVEK